MPGKSQDDPQGCGAGYESQTGVTCRVNLFVAERKAAQERVGGEGHQGYGGEARCPQPGLVTTEHHEGFVPLAMSDQAAGLMF